MSDLEYSASVFYGAMGRACSPILLIALCVLHVLGCGDRSNLLEARDGGRDAGVDDRPPGHADAASDHEPDGAGEIRDAQATMTDAGVADARVPDAAIMAPPSADDELLYIKASNPDADDWFGLTLALSDRWLAVSSWNESSRATGLDGEQGDDSEDRSGAVYLFSRDASGWAQRHYVKASNTGSNDSFGVAMALSDRTLVVGTPYEDSPAKGVNGDQGNGAGGNQGAVYVFVESDDTWQQQAYLKPSNTDPVDLFGSSVAIDGDTLVVGAPFEDSAASIDGDQADNSAMNSGAAYVFTRTSGGWAQTAYLKAANVGAGDEFGSSVAIHGDTIVVGADKESSSATGVDGLASDDSSANSGAVYVFERDGSSFQQTAYLKASSSNPDAEFGSVIAFDGDTLAVGADRTPSSNTLVEAGAVDVFERSGTTWRQAGRLDPSKPMKEAYFGVSLALSGKTLVVGAIGEVQNMYTLGGAAYVFVRDAVGWKLESRLSAPNAEGGDRFGSAIGINSTRLAIGASGESSDSAGIGGDMTSNRTPGAGAVYLYPR